MDTQRLLKLARRWALLVVASAVIFGGVTFAVTRNMTRVYRGEGSVIVIAAPRSDVSGLSLTPDQVAATDAVLIHQHALLQQVINELHLPLTVDQLDQHVSVTPQRNTELIQVAVDDPDPGRAAATANSLMQDFVGRVSQDNQDRIAQASASLQSQITQLEATLAAEHDQLASAQRAHADTTALQSQIASNQALLNQVSIDDSNFRSNQAQTLDSVAVASAAQRPSIPVSPRIRLDTALGALAGLLLGIGLAAFLHRLDDGLRGVEDVEERLGLPTLAVIPNYARRRRQGAADAAAEAYRRLRTNLLFTSIDEPIRSVVVTSVRASEGKTLTAANLAGSVAAAGQRVLLVDADMRRPSQHRIFGRSLSNGMSEVLLQAAREVMPHVNGEHGTRFANLSLLPSGTIPPNPAELLASRHLTSVVRALEQQHDLVVFDTPPASLVTDGLSVAAVAGATVIVVEAGRTSASQVRQTIESLQKVGAHVVGVVLNKAADRHVSKGGYEYYSTARVEETLAAAVSLRSDHVVAWQPLAPTGRAIP